MKAMILLLVVVCVGCASTPSVKTPKPTSTSWASDPSDPNNVKIEKAIRKKITKPTGELTKADLEKLTHLNLDNNQLTDVTALKGLTQLEQLILSDNPALTKAQIDELQKALPKCEIISNPKK